MRAYGATQSWSPTKLVTLRSTMVMKTLQQSFMPGTATFSERKKKKKSK